MYFLLYVKSDKLLKRPDVAGNDYARPFFNMLRIY